MKSKQTKRISGESASSLLSWAVKRARQDGLQDTDTEEFGSSLSLCDLVEEKKGWSEEGRTGDRPQVAEKTAQTPPACKKAAFSTAASRSAAASQSYTHHRSFLSPPRDNCGRTASDMDYDKTTLLIPEKEFSNMTPCEAQFWRIKMEYFDAIVLFKKGKFYELFEDDAVKASELFGLKLTSRGEMRMAGVPESGLEYWASRFVEKGYKVAVVDQKESGVAQGMKIKTGEAKKQVITRELKEVVTEVTCSQEGLSIAAVELGEGNAVRMAVFRPMESEFLSLSFVDDEDLFKTKTVMEKENVREVVSSSSLPLRATMVAAREDNWKVDPSQELKELLRTGGDDVTEEQVLVLRMLISYLLYLKHQFTPRLVAATFSSAERGKCMHIDGRTIENLGITPKNSGGELRAKGGWSLLSLIDRTRTKMGRRLLRRWIVMPLADVRGIEERYDLTEYIEQKGGGSLRARLIELLPQIGDVDDYARRGRNNKLRPADVRGLVSSLGKVREILQVLQGSSDCPKSDEGPSLLLCIIGGLRKCSISEELVEGFDIRDEVVPTENDKDLIQARKGRESVLKNLERYANEQSGILCAPTALRRVGREYSLEISNDAQKKIPASFAVVVAQTKASSRYTTPDLRRLSEALLEAEEEISLLAQESLNRIAKRVVDHELALREISSAIATLDCILSFTEISGARPRLSEDLGIKNLTNVGCTHIPNNISISGQSKLVVITGPNMAGKSTILRNTSIAIILRQVGIRVPASSFEGPIYDRVFTRIGAGDNLIEGESTFQVEMRETAEILRLATDKSFVIIDELGRGTSTREGSAISMAVKEYLKKVNCTTLYSTHFFNSIVPSDLVMKMDYKTNAIGASTPEKNEGRHPRLAEGTITYLYRLALGRCSDSCGIEICRITGVPQSVIQSALLIKERRKQAKQEPEECGGARKLQMATHGKI